MHQNIPNHQDVIPAPVQSTSAPPAAEPEDVVMEEPKESPSRESTPMIIEQPTAVELPPQTPAPEEDEEDEATPAPETLNRKRDGLCSL